MLLHTLLHTPPAHVETIEYDTLNMIDLHVVLRVPIKLCSFRVDKVLTLSRLFTVPWKISHAICTMYYISSLQRFWLVLWKAIHENCLVSPRYRLFYATHHLVFHTISSSFHIGSCLYRIVLVSNSSDLLIWAWQYIWSIQNQTGCLFLLDCCCHCSLSSINWTLSLLNQSSILTTIALAPHWADTTIHT